MATKTVQMDDQIAYLKTQIFLLKSLIIPILFISLMTFTLNLALSRNRKKEHCSRLPFIDRNDLAVTICIRCGIGVHWGHLPALSVSCAMNDEALFL